MVSGGVAAELGGGKFANGAVTGAFGYLLNYCTQNRCFNSRFNASVVEDHYRRGSGAPISVNVSEIEDLLNNPLVSLTPDKDRMGVYSVATFGRDGFGSDSQGRALGQITAVRQDDGGYKFYHDFYNFEKHENPTNNLMIAARNWATQLGGWIVGPGKSFDIIIKGTWKPK